MSSRGRATSACENLRGEGKKKNGRKPASDAPIRPVYTNHPLTSPSIPFPSIPLHSSPSQPDNSSWSCFHCASQLHDSRVLRIESLEPVARSFAAHQSQRLRIRAVLLLALHEENAKGKTRNPTGIDERLKKRCAGSCDSWGSAAAAQGKEGLVLSLRL